MRSGARHPALAPGVYCELRCGTANAASRMGLDSVQSQQYIVRTSGCQTRKAEGASDPCATQQETRLP